LADASEWNLGGMAGRRSVGDCRFEQTPQLESNLDLCWESPTGKELGSHHLVDVG
jgi:hypothetical protein